MTKQSLETRLGPDGLEYHHPQLGHIATKVFHPHSCWGLIPVDGAAAEVCRRLFGTTAGIGCETADWLALALAAQLIEEGDGEQLTQALADPLRAAADL